MVGKDRSRLLGSRLAAVKYIVYREMSVCKKLGYLRNILDALRREPPRGIYLGRLRLSMPNQVKFHGVKSKGASMAGKEARN